MADTELDEALPETPEQDAGSLEPETPPPKSRRDVMFEQIGEARDRDLLAESAEGEEEAPEDVQIEKEAPAAAIKVKVDGDEFDVSEDEIRDRLGLEGKKLQPSDIRNFQKHVSADRRLAQVAEERRNLEAREAAVAQREAAMAERAAAPAHEPAAEPSEDEAKALYESLFLGDETQGVDAVKRLLAKREQAAAAPAADVDAIAQQAATLAQRQIDWTAAQNEFAHDFSDLAGDPLLAQIASNTLQETLKTSRTYSEAFHKAGEATRKWLSTVSSKPKSTNGSTTPDDSFAEKRAKKEALSKAVVQPAGGSAGGPKEEHEETPGEIIASMRKARGLSI